jgi:hypothetical protein
MNASTRFEVAIATQAMYQGNEHFCHLNLRTVPEGTPFNQPALPPNGVRHEVLNNRTFEGFIDGAGI